MDKFILKHIDFDKCSFYLLFNGFLWVVSVAMVPVEAIPQKPFQMAVHFVELFLSTYVYLGLIKFSIIAKKDSFRKLIFAALALSLIQSSISVIAISVDTRGIYGFNGIPFTLESLIMFYAFRSIQNVKIIYFRQLSRSYLYLSFSLIPMAAAMFFRDDTWGMIIPHSLIKPLVILALATAVLIVLIWIMKIRLFKQLSIEMN